MTTEEQRRREAIFLGEILAAFGRAFCSKPGTSFSMPAERAGRVGIVHEKRKRARIKTVALLETGKTVHTLGNTFAEAWESLIVEAERNGSPLRLPAW